MVFVPMAQAPPKADAKELLYSLQSKFDRWFTFTSLFSPKVIVAGLPKGSFPTEACLCRHQCFSVVAQATQDSPKASPRAIFKMKVLDRTTEAIVLMNERWRKLNANMRQYVPFRANMGQHCSLSAVQRKTAFLEQS